MKASARNHPCWLSRLILVAAGFPITVGGPGSRQATVAALWRTVAALGLGLVWLAGPSFAVPVALPQNLTAGGGTWNVANTGGTSNGLPTGGTANGSPGLTIVDANDGVNTDAFDRALILFVDNVIFVAPALVDLTGQTLTAGPVALSGLNVTMQYQAQSTGGATLRTLATFSNPSAGPITVTATIVSNVGSNGLTGIRGTSNGNAVFTNLDAWVVSSDNAVDPPGDPANTFVVFGPSIGPRTPRVTPFSASQTVFTSSGTEGFLWNYAVTVPPGGTRSLMFLNQISATNVDALRQAALFSETHLTSAPDLTDFLAGLSQVQRSQILNWDFSVPPGTDFDGDGKADIAVYRTSTAEWFILRSSDNGTTQIQFGASPATGLGDVPLPADYDGDGIADLAVYRTATGEWFILRSSDGGLTQTSWGAPAATGLGDVPAPADYDGDGIADLAVYRNADGTWFISRSSDGGLTQIQWGAPFLGDVPVVKP